MFDLVLADVLFSERMGKTDYPFLVTRDSLVTCLSVTFHVLDSRIVLSFGMNRKESLLQKAVFHLISSEYRLIKTVWG